MPMILSLACTQLRMTPAEAITAATVNAAYALGREKRIGSLEVGKQADLAVFEVADYREIPYYFGVNHCWMTVKRGRVIHATKDSRNYLYGQAGAEPAASQNRANEHPKP